MASHDYECPNGHVFEGNDGKHLASDSEYKRCPECGVSIEACKQLELSGRAGTARRARRGLDDLSDEERSRIDVEAGLASKAEYEEMAEQLLSGELTLDESTVLKEFRPQVPEGRKRCYF